MILLSIYLFGDMLYTTTLITMFKNIVIEIPANKTFFVHLKLHLLL